MKTLLNRVEKVEMLNDFNKLQNEDKSVCMLAVLCEFIARESYDRASERDARVEAMWCKTENFADTQQTATATESNANSPLTKYSHTIRTQKFFAYFNICARFIFGGKLVLMIFIDKHFRSISMLICVAAVSVASSIVYYRMRNDDGGDAEYNIDFSSFKFSFFLLLLFGALIANMTNMLFAIFFGCCDTSPLIIAVSCLVSFKFDFYGLISVLMN